MTTVTDIHYATGVGWAAALSPTHIELHVDPEGDHLLDAIDALLSPVRRRFYVVEPAGIDQRGWDVYDVVNVAYLPTEEDFEVAAAW